MPGCEAGGVATDPLEFEDDFAVVVDRVRNETVVAGEHKAPAAGEYVPPFGPEERDAITGLLRDGTYQRSAAAVGEEGPELSDR